MYHKVLPFNVYGSVVFVRVVRTSSESNSRSFLSPYCYAGSSHLPLPPPSPQQPPVYSLSLWIYVFWTFLDMESYNMWSLWTVLHY